MSGDGCRSVKKESISINAGGEKNEELEEVVVYGQ